MRKLESTKDLTEEIAAAQREIKERDNCGRGVTWHAGISRQTAKGLMWCRLLT